MPKLTAKQQRFVEEYTVDFNATQAALRAGYSEKTAYSIGWENLRKPEIDEAIQERVDRLAMQAGEVLVRLSDQGRNLQMRFLQWDGTIDLQGLIDAGLAHLVKGTKFDREGRLQVEFYDAQSALKELARIRGMLTERRLDLDVSSLSTEALERIANGEDPLRVLLSSGKSGD